MWFSVWTAGAVTEESGRLALPVFDLSQNLVGIWRGSNFAARREILVCVSSNRALSDVTLCLEKRRPFDVFAERPFLKNSRGDWIRTSDLYVPNVAL